MQAQGGNSSFFNCGFLNFTGATANTSACFYCYATGNSGSGVFGGAADHCEAYSNTATPFTGNASNCLSYNNSGATTDGFAPTIGSINDYNAAYNNGRDGFRLTGTTMVSSSISEANAGFGYTVVASNLLVNSSDYNNTSGRRSTICTDIGAITGLPGSVFTNAAGGDFSLNNTVGQGALLRGGGFPSLFPAGTTHEFADVGAAQHQDAGGGAGLLKVGGMHGGMQRT